MRQYTAIMLPTTDSHRGRWITYRLQQYPNRQAYNVHDPLAYREAMQSGGFRMHTRMLKHLIKRRLGFKALISLR